MLAFVQKLDRSSAEAPSLAVVWTAANHSNGTLDLSASRATTGRTSSEPGLPWKRDTGKLRTLIKRLVNERELFRHYATLLDRDGRGIEVSLSFTADFDFQYVSDGFQERTASTAADNSVLVIDLNADGTSGAGDGLIDPRSELLLSYRGPEGETDSQALAKATNENGNLLFDTNGDSALDAKDTNYGEFRVLFADAANHQVHSRVSCDSWIDPLWQAKSLFSLSHWRV